VSPWPRLVLLLVVLDSAGPCEDADDDENEEDATLECSSHRL
jgi:hypothetical protein